MKKTLTIFLIIWANLTFAKETVKVIKMMGKATVLYPHNHKAQEIKENDLIPEDSSILTQDKSFIKIEYPDKTQVNIAPNTKLVVELIQNKKQAGLINLLKGVIRAKVSKEEDRVSEKFIVKTRTAAMGVRGTEFQFGVSEDQQTTSLLTFEGKVELTNKTITKEELIKSNDKPVIQGEIIKQGEFSKVVETEQKEIIVNKPIEINKTQFELLAKTEFEETNNQSTTLIATKDQPVIDFNSGAIIVNKTVELDKTGVIQDKEIIKQELVQKSKLMKISLSHGFNYYKTKFYGFDYEFSSNVEQLNFETKFTKDSFLWMELGLMASNSVFLEKTTNHFFTSQNSLDNNIALTVKLKTEDKDINNWVSHQGYMGVNQQEFFKEVNNVISNSFESGIQLGYKITGHYHYQFKTYLDLSITNYDVSDLNKSISLGLEKSNFGINGSFNYFKDQKNDQIRLYYNIEF